MFSEEGVEKFWHHIGISLEYNRAEEGVPDWLQGATGGLKLGKSMNRAVLQEERADTEIWTGFEWEKWQEQRQKGHLEVFCYG